MTLINYFINNASNILSLVVEHLQITGTAVLVAILIGVPLGILINYYTVIADPILGIASVLQTVPSIAFFGLLIPLTGIGQRTAILVLFLYALLPIIKNTYTGVNEVSASMVDAGRGMGLTDFEILRLVELPQALPVIMAGIRVATVINIGTTTIAAYIGGGGLGELIFTGISMNRNEMILAGAIPAAILAVLADRLLGYVEKRLAPKKLSRG
jgi:osmoprotectant transport system permease protein